MSVQVKINPETGLTACGNSIEREKSLQLLFSTVISSGFQGYGLGIPNVLRNADQLLSFTTSQKDWWKKDKIVEAVFEPHAYWSVDHRPKGTAQIVDSGMFTYLYGDKKDRPFSEIEAYTDLYIDFVNNHFGKYCFTNNTPWFVEIDANGRFPLEDYRKLQNKLLDKCPNRDFIGVWHQEHGIKHLDELCEKFDYISINCCRLGDFELAHNAIAHVRKHYPEKRIHILGSSSIHKMVWGNMQYSCDTCDCTTFSSSRRRGLVGYRREWVKPVEHLVDKYLISVFPHIVKEGDTKERSPYNGWTKSAVESSVWSLCKVWCEWSYFNLYGKQKQWDRGSFRPIIKMALEGRGAEATEADIGEWLYEVEKNPTIIHNYKFHMPIAWDGRSYADKFKNIEKCVKSQ